MRGSGRPDSAPRPGVSRGDHVYFQARDGARSGKVLAAGKHGATVESEGQRHRVYWHHVLGHKERVRHRVSLVERGEDGAIVQDEAGQHRFVAGEIPEAKGYLDPMAEIDPVSDGDLVTRRVESAMARVPVYQVLGGKLPPGAVLVGEDLERAPKLLKQLESSGLTVPYAALPRTLVRHGEERHGVLLAFSPDDQQLQALVNAVAVFQREAPLGQEEIIVRGRKVKGMQPAALAVQAMGPVNVLTLGEASGAGQTVYVSAEVMETMSKSMRPVLFLKASPIKNRPGLTLRDVTDKAGRQTKRWVRSDQAAPSRTDTAGKDKAVPSARVGETVSFRARHGVLSGRVVAAGKDGVTVDVAGEEHRVFWRDVSAGKTADDQPQDHAHLFAPEETKHLPFASSQAFQSERALYAAAKKALPKFTHLLDGIVGQAGGSRVASVDEALQKPGVATLIAPLKGKERARQKVAADYGGDWSQLRDVIRGTIAVDSASELRQIVHALQARHVEIVQRPKDRFTHPTPEGCRDVLLVIRIPDTDMLAELQIHLKPMLAAKTLGHQTYETIRHLKAKYMEDSGPSDRWSEEDREAFQQALQKSRGIYAEAWQKANQEGAKSLKKALNGPIIFLCLPVKEAS